ncbi:MAG: hypothetical protein JWM16_3214 [Verrucomicrobiales bacterium]|nr:hypothetical protein [Verrucomicrobiales bacterium]
MIPIKILCGCGQKYTFDVEPSSKGVGFIVQCPVCGTDGCEAANQIIRQHLATDKLQPPGLQIRAHSPSSAKVQNFPATPPIAPPLPAFTGRSKTKERLPKIFTACALLLLLLAAGGIAINRLHAGKAAPPAQAKVTASDFPDTLQQLNAWYEEPLPGHNAAAINLRAFATLKANNFKLPPPGAPMRASTISALEALVNSNRGCLDLLREAARLEQSRYPVDLAQGFETLLPHLIKFKDAARIAECSAALNAEQHRGGEAADDILAALALGRSLRLEPILTSQFLRAATLSMALGALEQTVNRTLLTSDRLNALAQEFQRLERSEARGDAFKRALIGERATALSIMRNPGDYLKKINQFGTGMKPAERDQWVACLKNATNFKEEVQYYEDTFQQLMLAREKPFPARLQADHLIRERANDAKSHGMAMNDFLMPGRGRAASKEASCLAYFRLGLAALALEQFHTTHGKQYPPSLSELPPQASPDALNDPFDGQPLRYERKGQGYLLYSIGPDLNDDAGERTHGKDLVFEVAGFAER